MGAAAKFEIQVCRLFACDTMYAMSIKTLPSENQQVQVFASNMQAGTCTSTCSAVSYTGDSKDVNVYHQSQASPPGVNHDAPQATMVQNWIRIRVCRATRK